MAGQPINPHPPNVHAAACPSCTSVKDLPYKAHPLFQIRRASISIASIGILLSFLGSSSYLYVPLMVNLTIILFFSAAFCFVDLLNYALKKARNPDQDPDWPNRRWLFGDFILCIWLQCIFWGEMSSMPYAPLVGVLTAWTWLTALLCSLLHAVAFWKELMARYEKRWRAKLPNLPCSRCGYCEGVGQRTASHPRESSATTFPYAGPSAEYHQQADVLTPEETENALEEGLLIATDFRNGYGAIAEPESVIDQPEEVVVAKGKRKQGVVTPKSSSNRQGSTTGS